MPRAARQPRRQTDQSGRTTCTSTRTRRPARPARRGAAKRATRSTCRVRPWSATRRRSGATRRGGWRPNEPPPRARHQAGRDRQPLQVAAEQRDDRGRLHPHLHDRALPRLHQTRSLHQLRLRAERDLLQLGQHRQELAGAHRRGRSRQSHRQRARRRRDHRQLHRRRLGAPDPRRRLCRDPTADLPRGQLLRRSRPRQPQRAGDGGRQHDPGQPHLDRGPDRRGADGAAVAGPGGPQPPAGRARHRLHARTAAEDATQLPEVKGRSGAEGLNDALKYGGDAGRYSAQVTDAFLGTQQRDLSRLVAGAGRTFGAFASREADLQGLIDNFNVFTGALAAQSANLSTTVQLLAPTLKTARASFVSLNRTLPPLRTYAIQFTPAVAQLPSLIAASKPWLAQVRPLLSGKEGGGVARLLAESTPGLAGAAQAGKAIALPQLNRLSLCTTKVMVPT